MIASNELKPFPWETNTSPAPALAPVSLTESVLGVNLLLQVDAPRWKANKLGSVRVPVAVAATMAASPEMLVIAGGAPNVAPVAVQV